MLCFCCFFPLMLTQTRIPRQNIPYRNDYLPIKLFIRHTDIAGDAVTIDNYGNDLEDDLKICEKGYMVDAPYILFEMQFSGQDNPVNGLSVASLSTNSLMFFYSTEYLKSHSKHLFMISVTIFCVSSVILLSVGRQRPLSKISVVTSFESICLI